MRVEKLGPWHKQAGPTPPGGKVTVPLATENKGPPAPPRGREEYAPRPNVTKIELKLETLNWSTWDKKALSLRLVVGPKAKSPCPVRPFRLKLAELTSDQNAKIAQTKKATNM